MWALFATKVLGDAWGMRRLHRVPPRSGMEQSIHIVDAHVDAHMMKTVTLDFTYQLNSTINVTINQLNAIKAKLLF